MGLNQAIVALSNGVAGGRGNICAAAPPPPRGGLWWDGAEKFTTTTETEETESGGCGEEKSDEMGKGGVNWRAGRNLRG